jgi:hypothetical protein
MLNVLENASNFLETINQMLSNIIIYFQHLGSNLCNQNTINNNNHLTEYSFGMNNQDQLMLQGDDNSTAQFISESSLHTL